VVYLHRVLPTDLTAGLPVITQGWTNFLAAQPEKKKRKHRWQPKDTNPVELLRAFAGTIVSGAARTLYYLHVLLPHVPWQFLPSGKAYRNRDIAGLSTDEMWNHDSQAVNEGLQRFILQVRFFDRLVDGLLSRIRLAGIYDEALIILTADHGVSFLPSDSRRTLSDRNVQDILAVPLFIKRPRQKKGTVSDRNVELIDILPTIADLLKIELPFAVDGRSLYEPADPERDGKRAFAYKQRSTDGHQTFPSRFQWPSELARKKLALFGVERDPERFFRMGPYQELLGRAPADAASPGASQLLLSFPAEVVVNPAHWSFPGRLTGRVTAPGRIGKRPRLALAVNGTVRALTTTYQPKGRKAGFAFMIPETAFRPGVNALRVYEVQAAAGGSARLVPLKTE
jgi:hypothetical protein